MEMKHAALVVTPHPMTLEGQKVFPPGAAALIPGETLDTFLARYDETVRPGQQWVVSIGGLRVPEAMWARTRPRPGQVIEARRVPEKDMLRIVAVAALSYFTFGAGGMAGGGFLGLTGAAGYLAAGAAFMAGSLVINKVLAPKQSSASKDGGGSPTYALNGGGRNRARPMEFLPLVLGEPYAVPDLGAQPYSYFANGEQHLWQIFNFGLNCADVSTLRLGNTPLESYLGVTVLRNGMASGNSDFPELGTSVDSVAGGALSTGVPVIRTTSPGTVRIALDFVAQLFLIDGNGVFITYACDVMAEYRLVGSAGPWTPFTDAVADVPAVTTQMPAAINESETQTFYSHVLVPGVPGHDAGIVRLASASQKPLRVSKEKAVAPGKYEVRLTKLSPPLPSASGSSEVEWTQLRSYQVDTGYYEGQARLAIQIQASGQLNGTLDEVNGQARAQPMDYWNGSAWVTATDRASGLCNPGAIILLLARGRFDSNGRRLFGMGRSDDQIDIEGLKRFMVHCKENGFEFDLFQQRTIATDELIDLVAYAGLGELSWPDGKLGVTFYSVDEPIQGVINMANIKAGTFSVTYDTRVTADEVDFAYFDRARGNVWKSLRVMAPGVTIPRSTAPFELTGVGAELHAAKLARFTMGQSTFQRKTVFCDMDLEYMTLRKGGVYALSHDMTQWGYSGRLLACQVASGVVTLTLDDFAPGDDPLGVSTARYIGLHLPGEMQMRVFPVAAFSGEARSVVLAGAWPVGVPLPGASADNPACDTRWIYDFKAVPGQRLMVTEITPNGSGARIAMVPWSDEFLEFVHSGAYLPPPNNSQLRPAPSVNSLRILEELKRQGNTYYTELSVDLDVQGDFQRAELWGAVGDGDVAPSLVLLAKGTSQVMSWRGGLDERWHLEVRCYGALLAGAPYRAIYDVVGLRAPPADVTNLAVNGSIVTWTPVSVPDLAGYLLRFQYGDNAWWDTAVPLHTGVITESPHPLARHPQGDVTVLAKALDTTGNESVNAAAFRYGFSPIVVKNPVVAIDQHPLFSGVITGGTVSGGSLLADDLDLFYEPEAGAMYLPEDEPMYGASQYGQMVYEFSVSSVEAGLLVLQYSVAAESMLIEYQTGGAEPIYLPGSDPMYLPADELLYGEFGPWQVWPGSLEVDGASEVRFRMTLEAGLSQGVIYSLTALIDAPEISEVVDDIAIAAGGTRLPLVNTYRVIRSVIPAVHADGGAGVGARLIDKNPTLGPLVEILNTSGVAVAGRLDAEILGY